SKRAACPWHFVPTPGEAPLEIRAHSRIDLLCHILAVPDAFIRHQMFDAKRRITEGVEHHDAAIAGLSERGIEKGHVFGELEAGLRGLRPVAGSRLQINTACSLVIQLFDGAALGWTESGRGINASEDCKRNRANQEIAGNDFATVCMLHDCLYAVPVLMNS